MKKLIENDVAETTTGSGVTSELEIEYNKDKQESYCISTMEVHIGHCALGITKNRDNRL